MASIRQVRCVPPSASTTDPALSQSRGKALPGKDSPSAWQFRERWSRGKRIPGWLRPGTKAFACGASWTPVVIEAVDTDRVMVRGRCAGSTAITSYAVYDTRNLVARRVLTAMELLQQQTGGHGGWHEHHTSSHYCSHHCRTHTKRTPPGAGTAAPTMPVGCAL